LPDIKVRLLQALAEADLDEPLRERLVASMDSLPKGDRLLHGALQPSVVVLHKTGPLVTRCGALAQGHPDADVAITLVHLALAVPPANARLWPLLDRARRTFLDSYQRTIINRRPHHNAAA
jgi:fructosamine-3-kinase